MEGEEDLKRLHDEVPLSVPAENRPDIVPEVVPENVSQIPASRQQLFSMGGLEGIPATSTTQESPERPPISELRERVSVLRKPYPGAPIVISQGVLVWEQFNFGQNQAQAQVGMPTSFAMGISKAQDTSTTPAISGEKYDKEEKQTKSSIGT